MNLIDKLFRKLGYVRIMKQIPIVETKFKLELVKMDYEVRHYDNPGTIREAMQREYEEKAFTQKFLLSLAPFIEKRLYMNYPLKTNEQDRERFEFRIYVAKPPVHE